MNETPPQSPARRAIDVAAKAAVAFPLAMTTTMLTLEAWRSGGMLRESFGLSLWVAATGACLWSAWRVASGRALAQATWLWALVALLLWGVAVPRFLEMRRHGLENARRAEAERSAHVDAPLPAK